MSKSEIQRFFFIFNVLFMLYIITLFIQEIDT